VIGWGRSGNITHELFYPWFPSILGATLAHLTTIRRAYLDCQEVALIVEDDLSPYFMPYWTRGIGDVIKALSDRPWDSVQLQYTLNPQKNRILHSSTDVIDGFLYKKPYEWGSAAYLVSRRGMEKIMKKYFSDMTTTGNVVIVEQFRGGLDNVIFPRTFTEHYQVVPAMFCTLAKDTTFRGSIQSNKNRMNNAVRSNNIQWMEWNHLWNQHHVGRRPDIQSTLANSSQRSPSPQLTSPAVIPSPPPLKKLSQGMTPLQHLSNTESFTIGIKTFGRAHLVLRLCTSIRESIGDGVRILVADDGRYNVSDDRGLNAIEMIKSQCHAEYVPLPYDSGLAAGRNEMVRRTMTRYYMSLDDDFVAVPGAFKPANLIAFLDTHPGVDIVGSTITVHPRAFKIMKYHAGK